MKTGKNLLTLLWLMLVLSSSGAVAQALPASTPASVGLSADRLQNISKVFGDHVSEGNIAGAVFMVARDGKLVYSDAIGFRDPVKREPMTPDAIFRIYSMSKPLVSVAAMMLVEDGVVQLTDPVSKFLPSIKDLKVSVASADVTFAKMTYTLVPAAREMTVHDLLDHSPQCCCYQQQP